VSVQIPALCVPAAEMHHGLIFSSWINELRDGMFGREDRGTPEGLPPWCGRSWLASAQHALIEQLLAARDTETLVAVNPDHIEQIYGYAVARPGARVLYWVYTRGRFRRGRIATLLLTELFGAGDRLIEVAQPTHRLAWFANSQFDLRPRPHVICEALR